MLLLLSLKSSPSPKSRLHSLLPTAAATRKLSAFSSPSSSSSPSGSPPLLHNLAFVPIAHPFLDLDLDAAQLANSFKGWFKEGAVSLSLPDRIYDALASAPDDYSLDATLAAFRLPLSEAFVLGILCHRPSPSPCPSNLLLLRLKFFDWSARQRGYRHSRAAYHAIFRILSRARLASVIFDWLRLFSSPGSSLRNPFHPAGPQPRLHDTLVVGYSLAGRPDLALPIIARIRFHGLDLDPFSYHVLINSLVESSNFDLADSLLFHLQSRGLSSPISDTIRIKSLCLQNKVDDALSFLRDLVRSNSDWPQRREHTDHAVATLVHALFVRGRFEEAEQVVDELGAFRSYGVWFSDLISARRLEAAMEFLQAKKNSEDYVPETRHYNKLISLLLQRNRLDKVYNVLVEMRQEGVAPDRATMNATLCFFCKAGMVDIAVQLYNSRFELGLSPNRLVYNYLITTLCRVGSVDEVWQLVEESMKNGYFPGRETFKIVADMLCREGKVEKMTKLLDGALQRDVRPPTYALARYIAALCKAGQVEKACLVPHMFRKQNIPLGRYKHTYTSLIHAFITVGRLDVLPQLIIEMQEHGHTPSRILYREVICSLSERGKFDDVLILLDKQLEQTVIDQRTSYNYFMYGAAYAKKPELAREVYNRMRTAGIEPNMDSNILILQSYLKSRRIGDALGFFYYLMEKRQHSTKLYNVFITGLCEAGKSEQAVVFWREAREKMLIPSLECYEQLVFTLCSSKDYDIVVKVLNDFKQTGRPVSSFLCNVLLLHTLKSPDLLHAWNQHRDGDLDTRADEASEDTHVLGRLMLGQLIAGFSGGIRIKDDPNRLDETLESYFPVDIFTYNMLLRGLTMAGKMEEACSLFNKIQMKGLEPNRWSFDIIVHGFCKLGWRNDAQRWMREMHRNGFQPTWQTISLYYNTP